jgi:hypothetical protein
MTDASVFPAGAPAAALPALKMKTGRGVGLLARVPVRCFNVSWRRHGTTASRNLSGVGQGP